MGIGLGILTFGTLGFVLAFAYASIRAIEKHKASDAPKSALSRDGIAERMSRQAKARS